MAQMTITIRDIDAFNIAVDVGGNQLPASALLYTNAQMLGLDLLKVLEQMGKQINDKQNQRALEEAVNFHV